MRARLVLALGVLAGCDLVGSSPTITAVLLDPDDDRVATVEMTLDDPLAAGMQTEGEYLFRHAIEAALVSEGPMVASCSDQGALVITLDPNVPDGGLVLQGGCVPSLTGGTWVSLGVAGPMAGGRFTFGRAD